MINQSIWRSNFRILWLSQFIAIAGLTVLVPLLPIYMASLQNLSVVEIQLWSEYSDCCSSCNDDDSFADMGEAR